MKEIKLELIKNETGVTATNVTEGTIDYFDESDEARSELVKYLVEEFLNKEIEDGVRYK